MKVHTTGTRNIAIGNYTMDDTDAGSTSLGSTDNIFMGHSAGGGTWANAATNGNVGIGSYVMDSSYEWSIIQYSSRCLCCKCYNLTR